MKIKSIYLLALLSLTQLSYAQTINNGKSYNITNMPNGDSQAIVKIGNGITIQTPWLNNSGTNNNVNAASNSNVNAASNGNILTNTSNSLNNKDIKNEIKENDKKDVEIISNKQQETSIKKMGQIEIKNKIINTDISSWNKTSLIEKEEEGRKQLEQVYLND